MPRAALLVVILGAASACTTYSASLAEFDSVTGDPFAGDGSELLPYDDEAARLHWSVRWLEGSGIPWALQGLGMIEPVPYEVENPAGFARDRSLWLIEKADDSPLRIAEVTARLMWVLLQDRDHDLNQAIAVRGLRQFGERLGVDPLEMPMLTTSAPQTLDSLRSIERGLPQFRERPLTAEQRQRHLNNLQLVQTRYFGRYHHRLILRLITAVPAERDRELRAALVRTLDGAVRNGIAQTLKIALRVPSSAVQEEAAISLAELSGADGLSFALFSLREVPNPVVRRKLVRLCGNLPPEDLFVQAEIVEGVRGPMPVQFLFDTAQLDPDEGLRVVALEALAIALQRPVDFDVAWSERWMKDLALRGAQGIGSQGAPVR